MRHPHPLISLLSLMLLCSIRATSHEQPLNTISLSAPEDRCGLLQLPLTAYFHNLEVVTSRSSPTHDLERRLVQFLRLPRATLGLLSCLIPEGCGPDAAGFSGPYSSVLCHPFERHCCRPSALDTSTTALTALKSTSCSIMGLSLGDRRSFGPLSCTYVISFPGPHSELPVSSFSPVHRDRHSRPARAPVHAPAHLPSHVASPITHPGAI